MHLTIDQLIDKLRSAAWFSAIGQPIDDPEIQLVTSWEEAIEWTSHPVSKWCSTEAKMKLYETLAKSHYDQFRKWNVVAKELLPRVVSIIDEVVLPAAAATPLNLATAARMWIQTQLLGAIGEAYYWEFVPLDLFDKQIDLFVEGHFACGWNVRSPEEFPMQSKIVVF